MYGLYTYGGNRSYKDFFTKQWVSKKPKRFMVGIDVDGEEIYVGDIIQCLGGVSYFSQHTPLKVADAPSYSGWISVINSNDITWPFKQDMVKVISH